MGPTGTVLQKGFSSYQKYHLTKMAPNIKGTSPSHNYIIGFLKHYQHPANRTPTNIHRRVIGISLLSRKIATWKSHDHVSESYNIFKNSLSKITQLSHWQISFVIWAFFRKMFHFCEDHFLWVPYLSISGGVFVMRTFYKVPLFSNGIKGCHFCWVYLMVVKL